MVQQAISRGSRRMERKQALILLVLVLGVSLVSFTLGVMVGRGSGRTEIHGASAAAPVPERMAVVRGPKNAEAPPAPAEPQESVENLTFFDTLPKGEQPPLGSGINLPPRTAGEERGSASSRAPSEEAPATKKAPVRKALPEEVASAPAPAVGGGGYVLQVASFRQVEDARGLQDRLAKKGYPVYVQAADLAEKGVWHRVYVGPFEDPARTEKTLARLQSEEKLAPILRKR